MFSSRRILDVPAFAACDVQAVAGVRGVDTLSQAGARVEAGQGALVGVHTLKYRGEREGVSQAVGRNFQPSLPAESPRRECSLARTRTCSSPACSYRSRAGRYPIITTNVSVRQ